VNGTTPSGYPNTTTWTCGENVTLNAVAASGYEFDHWSGNLSGSDNPSNITMNGDKSVTAHFGAVTYNLTVTSDGCCPINVSGAASGTVSAGGSETFTGIGEGGNVTVSADDSAVCCEFDSWSDAGAQTHTITMDSDKSVTAYCSVPSYNLTVNVTPDGGGNVTVNGTTPSGYPNTTTWTCGENVTLNAVAAGGYEFDHWSGDLSGNTTPTNITMDGDKYVTANFEEHLPKICVEPSSLPLRLAPNTPATATYTITNCGGGILNWNSSNVTYVPNGNMSWLRQNITSGSLTANASDTVLVTVNTTGLGVGTYNAFITITGSTFVLPIILDVTEPTDIDVMRDLPPDALDYDAEYPGMTFSVYVNFTASVNDFNSIGLTDFAPAGWEVETNTAWCVPAADWTMSPYNKAEYSWAGPFTAGQVISARYNVTIPATASPGSNFWPTGDPPECNCTPGTCPPCEGSPQNLYAAWIEYWVGNEGPYESCIIGECEKIVTVPGCETGETRDVLGNVLDTVLVTLYEDDDVWEDDDSSSIVGGIAVYEDCADDTGYYYKIATKYCYFPLDTRPVADGGRIAPPSHNPNYPAYIDWSTPELLAAGNVLNFVGDYGLVCRAASMSMAMEAVNHMLFVPLGDDGVTPEPDWQLSNWKAMEVVHSWQFPCGCHC